MCVTLMGRPGVTEERFEQDRKDSSPMNSRAGEKVTSARAGEYAKVLSSMRVTAVSDRSIETTPDASKAETPISISDAGKKIARRAVQPLKLDCPIDVRFVAERFTEARPVDL